MPWSNSPPQRCAYCGGVGARTVIVLGWAHKRCIPKVSKRKGKYKGPPDTVKREPAFQDNPAPEQQEQDGE